MQAISDQWFSNSRNNSTRLVKVAVVAASLFIKRRGCQLSSDDVLTNTLIFCSMHAISLIGRPGSLAERSWWLRKGGPTPGIAR